MKKINLINEKLNEIKGKNEENGNIIFDEEISIDNNNDNNNQTIKYEKLDNGNYKIISSENKNEILDNFVANLLVDLPLTVFFLITILTGSVLVSFF